MVIWPWMEEFWLKKLCDKGAMKYSKRRVFVSSGRRGCYKVEDARLAL